MTSVKYLLFFATLLMLGGCGTTSWENTAPVPPTNTTGELPRSKQGNPPFYEVYGIRYTVMRSSGGYRERGVASWYGKKFHGRATSSGERYDMYQMTAAHKTLPLPTNVRVTNLQNGRSITVRVNDRGPFVDNRLIDLSYAAARELGIITNGTGMVEVVALTSPTTASTLNNPAGATTRPATQQDGRMYVQVGAFGEQANARALASKLASSGIRKVAVHKAVEKSAVIYRVRIGPITGAAEYDDIVREVESMDIAQPHLVIEPG